MLENIMTYFRSGGLNLWLVVLLFISGFANVVKQWFIVRKLERSKELHDLHTVEIAVHKQLDRIKMHSFLCVVVPVILQIGKMIHAVVLMRDSGPFNFNLVLVNMIHSLIPIHFGLIVAVLFYVSYVLLKAATMKVKYLLD